MIQLEGINKVFKISKRGAGMAQAAKALFKKEYTYIKALQDVSFTIQKGEMVGYIGPNGAGKSSTIKVMSGILTPDSGSCVIDGLTPWKSRKEHVRNIGVVFGQRSQLWWDVPVIDSFELIRDIYKVEERAYKKNLDEMTEIFGLSEILKTPVRQLSLGQRMRCEISASLLHNPDILFLDEPTIGLDAVSKIAVREFIRQINHERKTTVILTTHDMQDIEALTERILLIGKGQILLDGSLEEFKKRGVDTRKIKVFYTKGEFTLPEGVEILESKKGYAEFLVDMRKISVSKAIEKLSANAEITDISITGNTAEDMVISLYQEFEI